MLIANTSEAHATRNRARLWKRSHTQLELLLFCLAVLVAALALALIVAGLALMNG
jgi:hypothetical protein